MRTALLVLLILAATAAQPDHSNAALRDEITATRLTLPGRRELLAQRQPGGLPGVSDSDEDARSGPKQVPGGLPGRAKPAEMPATRSLQSPKAPSRPDPGAESGGSAGKKAAPARKPAPDGSK
jgi:hypothetical protein